MITLRKATERLYERTRKREGWNTFFPVEGSALFPGGSTSLMSLREERLGPKVGVLKSAEKGELITWVREGALSYSDSLGCSGVIQAGEFQCLRGTDTLKHSVINASQTDWAHLFRIWLRPAATSFEPGREQRRFSAAERRGVWCIVGSSDSRNGSLKLNQDVCIYTSLLERGKHVVHELSPGRQAWLQVVQGSLLIGIGQERLDAGDGAAFTDERAVSLTALERAEVLLVDQLIPVLKAD